MEMSDKRPRHLSYGESKELHNPLYIDVRSPAEYGEDHIPGALNLPLFDDQERARIGELYRQNQQQARFLGLDIAAAKLPRLLRELAALQGTDRNLLLYCWRGGLRSQAVQDTAELMRIPCQRLAGGYRDYRHWLLEHLSKLPPLKPVVLHGLTGCGKTAVLQLLKQEHGLQVLDLEGLAGHRGSVFGHIGLAEQPSQKYFQSLLLWELEQIDPQKPLFVECESRRIGRLLLEEALFEAMGQGRRILLYDSPTSRARRLAEDYAPDQHQEGILEALHSPPLRKKFSAERLSDFAAMLRKGAYAELIEYLLLHYYDPLYHYPDHPAPDYELCVDSADEVAAAEKIAAFVKDGGKSY